MVRANRIAAIVFLLGGLFVGRDATTYNLWSDFGPGPGFWPLWLAAAWIVLAVLWYLESGKGDARQPYADSLMAGLRPWVVMGIFLAYLLIVDKVKFLPATFFFLMAIIWLFERRGLVGSLVNSVAIPGVIYLIFETFLKVGLPGGPMFQ